MKSIFNKTLNFLWWKSAMIDFVHKFEVAMATFKNLLNMAVLEKGLNKMDIVKVG